MYLSTSVIELDCQCCLFQCHIQYIEYVMDDGDISDIFTHFGNISLVRFLHSFTRQLSCIHCASFSSIFSRVHAWRSALSNMLWIRSSRSAPILQGRFPSMPPTVHTSFLCASICRFCAYVVLNMTVFMLYFLNQLQLL